MRTLVYEGPGKQLKLLGRLIPRGEPFEIDDATAAVLLERQPRVRVRDVTTPRSKRREPQPEPTDTPTQPDGQAEESAAGANDETEVT
jgi:hypothetical protein